MDKSQLKKVLLLAVIILIIFLIPPPSGLNPIAWYLFGVYLAAIVGLILKPYEEPVILIAAIAISAVTIGLYNNFFISASEELLVKAKDVLYGYSSTTTWLVFAAFSLSVSFVVTGLGKRIAFWLIKLVGSSTLRLGYIDVILELILAPGMPSNTARAGGVIAPIYNSVSVALDSDPKTSPTKAGRYLLTNVYMVTKQSSYMFLTAMAPNVLALKLLHDVNPSFNLDWIQWCLAASVPGLLCILLTPLVTYWLCTPELKKVDNKSIARDGLKEIGQISVKEKILCAVFFLVILGWITGKWTGIDATSMAIVAMAVLLLLNVISWGNILQSKGGWSTLIWYGGIIGLSEVLSRTGFFLWLGKVMENYFDAMSLGSILSSDSGYFIVVLILFISVAIRYIFASGGAYIAAMIPVFGLTGMALGAPYEILAIGLLFSNGYGGSTTHYGSAPAPLIFAYGYNTVPAWWKVGNVMGYGTLIIHCTLGIAWWTFLIKMGFL